MNIAISKQKINNPKSKHRISSFRTLGPVSDLEKHLPPEWWKSLFNSIYLKTDGDVVENSLNTKNDINMLISATGIEKDDQLLDLCCGQGRHSLELAGRGFINISGIDRSRYLIRLARKRAKQLGFNINFSEGDARKIKQTTHRYDCVFLMGNSFGYFEREEDDVAVLESIKKVLKSEGKVVLDIVDGVWMRSNYEPRSWEWIDQSHMVCRERTISTDGRRIVSREVVVNAEIGVIADQFYAERLYTPEEIIDLLKEIGFEDVVCHGNIISDSTRGQDLGMMANRLFITAVGPQKIEKQISISKDLTEIAVLLGDPKLPDIIKNNGVFNQEDMETINILKKNLAKLGGFQFTYFSDHKTLLTKLIEKPPTFVFNLCDEGYGNKATQELHVTAFLEMLNVPYTGAGPECLSICYNKSIVRAVALDLDIPVPLETYYDVSDQAANLPSVFPAILKPNFGDSSIGITQSAVVYNTQDFMFHLDKLKEILPNSPILIQEFLQGNEYSVGIVGNAGRYETLPVLEVDYSALPENLPKILGYESKWVPESPYWTNIKYRESNLEEDSKRKLYDYSIRLFEKLGCKDYARFDFRTDSEGIIKLLEVNPNPGWCWDGKLNLMAGFKGIKYHELLGMILEAAQERMKLGH